MINEEALMPARRKKATSKIGPGPQVTVRKSTRKPCARCGKRKKLDQFGTNPRMKLGRKSYCRKCCSWLQRRFSREQGARTERYTPSGSRKTLA